MDFFFGVAGHHCEMNFIQFASYFVATVSIQEKQRHRSSRKGVRSSEMIREISNSVDSVAIFGSPWPCPTPFFVLGSIFCCIFFALLEAVNMRNKFFCVG